MNRLFMSLRSYSLGVLAAFTVKCEGTDSTTLSTDFFYNKDSDGIYYTSQDKLKYMGYW